MVDCYVTIAKLSKPIVSELEENSTEDAPSEAIRPPLSCAVHAGRIASGRDGRYQ